MPTPWISLDLAKEGKPQEKSTQRTVQWLNIVERTQ